MTTGHHAFPNHSSEGVFGISETENDIEVVRAGHYQFADVVPRLPRGLPEAVVLADVLRGLHFSSRQHDFRRPAR